MPFFMKCFLLNLLTVCCCQLNAQEAYRLTYEGEYKNTGPFFNPSKEYTRVILTDTAYFIFPTNSARPEKETYVYSKDIKHHSMYYFPNSGHYYFGNNFRSKPYVVKSVPRPDSLVWSVETTVTHYFQNLKCANAFKVDSAGDTTFVVYTPDIKYPLGLNYYTGLPGLVLERFSMKLNYYEKLIRLEMGPYAIILPQDKIKLKHR